MKRTIKALGGFGIISILFATIYFISLYQDFQQLIFALGIAGLGIMIAFIFIYDWIEETKEELEGLGRSIDIKGTSLLEVREKIGMDK